MTLHARAYDPARDAAAWDRFVDSSRTPHVLFRRGFLEYHADRFTDASVVVEDPDKPGMLVAVLPASAHGAEVRSHGGLTFGGILTTAKVGASRMVDVVAAVRTHLADAGFTTLRYKPAPHPFHTEPAEEDLWAVVQAGAVLARRDVSAAIDLRRPSRLSKGRRGALKAADPSVGVRPSSAFDEFVELETEVLQRHGAAPVHTGAELALLHGRFPDVVQLHAGFDGDRLLGGVVTLETPTVLHTQYIGAGDEGRARGVLDRILVERIEDARARGLRWFSFGISTERDGAHLNAGLAAHKESFGARAIVFDHYDVPLG